MPAAVGIAFLIKLRQLMERAEGRSVQLSVFRRIRDRGNSAKPCTPSLPQTAAERWDPRREISLLPAALVCSIVEVKVSSRVSQVGYGFGYLIPILEDYTAC